jgi:hypothetical protein
MLILVSIFFNRLSGLYFLAHWDVAVMIKMTMMLILYFFSPCSSRRDGYGA